MWLAGSSRVAAWASRAIAHLALWAFALLAWLALTYLGFGVLTILDTAQGASVIHGGWLIAIVGTQSLVILGGRSGVTADYWKDHESILAFARDPEHRIAKKKGREIWYSHDFIRVCKVERDYGRPEP